MLYVLINCTALCDIALGCTFMNTFFAYFIIYLLFGSFFLRAHSPPHNFSLAWVGVGGTGDFTYCVFMND